MQSPGSHAGRALWVLVVVAMLLVHQVALGPVVQQPQDEHAAPSGTGWLLRRVARMTPFLRMMGSKPNGAYCQKDFECASWLCTKGHCAFNTEITS